MGGGEKEWSINGRLEVRFGAPILRVPRDRVISCYARMPSKDALRKDHPLVYVMPQRQAAYT
jgi:hypothetical protein